MKKEEEIILPTKPRGALTKSPTNLMIFSKPKVGKTSLVAQLPNWLILDLEPTGSDYVECMSIKADSVEKIAEIMKQIKLQDYPYDGIIIDTVTVLEDMCVPYAEKLYARTSMGVNWFKRTEEGTWHPESGKAQYGSVLNLPKGAGYGYLRQAFEKMIGLIESSAKRTILLCHVKDSVIDNKDKSEVNSLDIDLTGKLKRITCSNSDAIGYLYRKGNQNILSFITKEEVVCGARPLHLHNSEFVISEMNDDVLSTFWGRIYID